METSQHCQNQVQTWPLCVCVDWHPQGIKHPQRGFFPTHPAETGEFPLGLGVLIPLKAHPALQIFPGPARGAVKPHELPAGGMEHMSPTTWNTLGQAPSRRTPTDPQEPQTWSSHLARSSKYVIHRGGNNFRFALSPFSLCLFQLISDINTAENVPVVF